MPPFSCLSVRVPDCPAAYSSPFSQLTLQQHRVQPAAMLETDVLQRADFSKSGAKMQRYRRDVRTVPPQPLSSGGIPETGPMLRHDRVRLFPPPLPLISRIDVHRIFNRKPVGMAFAVAGEITVADDRLPLQGDIPGKST
uniref:Uncharacterized protein n=1 Tax=Klebsiella pneumoniae TaxID=573 RepID=A0A8B0SPS1_KLEPN|nr:hypothetical protein [Klebsiella pneumoniae]